MNLHIPSTHIVDLGAATGGLAQLKARQSVLFSLAQARAGRGRFKQFTKPETGGSQDM